MKEIKGLDLFNEIKEDTDLSVLNIGLNKISLTKQQRRSVGMILKNRKAIDMTDTGLGKSYDMIAFVQALLPISRDNNTKIVMCVGKNKLVEFTEYLKLYTDANAVITTGEKDKVTFLKTKLDTTDVILCTPSAWQKSLEFNILMYNLTSEGKILAVIYDEADNLRDKGFLHCIEIGRVVNFALWANATPIGSASTFGTNSLDELRVTYNLLWGCGAVNEEYMNFRSKYTLDCGKTSTRGTLTKVLTDKINEDFREYLINVNRVEMGAETIFQPIKFHRCFATSVQLQAMEKKLPTHNALYSPEMSEVNQFKLTPQNVPALSKLISILTGLPAEESKIIYVHNTKTILILREFLQIMGYNVMVLDGKITVTAEQKDKMRILFNKTPGTIALINIIKGSNLGTAKHVIVYDTPSDLFQYIARSTRGFDSKTISFNMIYYPDFEEENMFNHLNMLITANSLGDRQSGLIEPFKQELRDVYPTSARWKSIE